MLERVVETIHGWGSVPIFIGAVCTVAMAAMGVAEATRWYKERRR